MSRATAARVSARARTAARAASGTQPTAQPKEPLLSPVRRFELRLHALCRAARMLPMLTSENAHAERLRLTACLFRDEQLSPRFALDVRPVPASAFRLIDELRRIAPELPGAALYGAKLDELELELMVLDALGRPRLVRGLAARRYGTGDTLAPTAEGPLRLSDCARRILDRVQTEPEPKVVPPDGEPGSLASIVLELAREIGLEVQVRVEPRLASGAAAGEHTVFIADRKFGRIEALRLAVHEVLGHLVAAANGRAQPLRLLEWGTAGSFTDQEGLALYLEEQHGLMDGRRLRVLAGRVLATDCMHAGASFTETARKLCFDEGFTPAETISIVERAYRGGGVARDAAYLLGWLRVHDAIARGLTTVDELRAGRLALDALPEIRTLAAEGYAVPPLLRPNFSRSFFATKSETTPRTSPPSDAASLIRLELTKK